MPGSHQALPGGPGGAPGGCLNAPTSMDGSDDNPGVGKGFKYRLPVIFSSHSSHAHTHTWAAASYSQLNSPPRLISSSIVVHLMRTHCNSLFCPACSRVSRPWGSRLRSAQSATFFVPTSDFSAAGVPLLRDGVRAPSRGSRPLTASLTLVPLLFGVGWVSTLVPGGPDPAPGSVLF